MPAEDDLLQERTELSPQIPQNAKEQQDPRERITPPKAQTSQATEYLKQFKKVVTSEEGLARWMDETRDILEHTKLTLKCPQGAKERQSLHKEAPPPKMQDLQLETYLQQFKKMAKQTGLTITNPETTQTFIAGLTK